MKRDKKFLKIAIGALFSAIVFVCTALFPIPIPSTAGYIHAGDAVIYLAACLLPTAPAVACAVIGAGLADLLLAPVYLPATVIIKACLVLVFTCKGEKILVKRNVLAPVICALITILGYAVTDAVIYSSFAAGVACIAMNAVQAGGSLVIFYIVAAALDKFGAKKHFWR